MKVDFARRFALVLASLGIAGSSLAYWVQADDLIPIVSGTSSPFNPFERPIVPRPSTGQAASVNSSSTRASAPTTPSSSPMMRLPSVTSSPPTSAAPSSSPASNSPAIRAAASPVTERSATARPTVVSAVPSNSGASQFVPPSSSSSSRSSSGFQSPIIEASSPALAAPVASPSVAALPASDANRSALPTSAPLVTIAPATGSSFPAPAPVATSPSASTPAPQAPQASRANPISARSISLVQPSPSDTAVQLERLPSQSTASPTTATVPSLSTPASTDDNSSSQRRLTVAAPIAAPSFNSVTAPEPPAALVPSTSTPTTQPTIMPVNVDPTSSSRSVSRASLTSDRSTRAPLASRELQLDDTTSEIILPEEETYGQEMILDGEMTSVMSGWQSTDYFRGCPRRSYAIAEALLFDREGEFTQLSNQFSLDGFDAQMGGRATFGVRGDCLDGWDASFMTTESWINTSQLAGAGLTSNFVAGGGLAPANISAFNGANFQQHYYKSRLSSAEINRNFWGWDVVTTSYGLRYIQLDERLRYTSVNGGNVGVLQVETHNHIIGPQIGSEWFYDIGGRFYLSGKLKLGAFLNFNDGSGSITNSGPVATGIANADSGVGFSALGETQMSLFYKLTRNTRIRGGYEIWYLYGAATANDQLSGVVTPTFGRSIDDEDDLFMHGASIGFEWVR